MKTLFLFQKLFRVIAQWHNRRRSIIDLTSMPDYLLADIGIARHEIIDVVHGLQAKSLGAKPVQTSKKPLWVAGKQTATSGA